MVDRGTPLQNGIKRLASSIVNQKTSDMKSSVKSTRTQPKSPTVTPTPAATNLRRVFAFNQSGLGNSDYSNSVREIVSRMTFKGDLAAVGRDTFNNVQETIRDIIDVSDESTSIDANFKAVAEQISILSTFAIKMDQKVEYLAAASRSAVTSLASETNKAQTTLVSRVNKKFDEFDITFDEIRDKVEVHDRQIDELYADLRKRATEQKNKSFLSSRNKRPGFGSNDNFTNDNHKKNGGLPEIVKDVLGFAAENPLEAAAGGYAAYRAGKAAVKGAARATGRAVSGAGRAAGKGVRLLNKGMATAGEASGRAAGSVLERLGAKGAAKLGGKLGARLIPGLGWVIMGYDAYEGYMKDGISGAAKNVATLGLYEALKPDDPKSANPQKKPNEAPSVEGLNINSLADINIKTQKVIYLESKEKIVLKGAKIILDSDDIEFKGNVKGYAGDPDKSGASQAVDPKNKKSFAPRGNPVPNKPTGKSVFGSLGDAFTKLFSGTTPMAASPGGGIVTRGGGISYSGVGGNNGGGVVNSSKPIIPIQQSALTQLFGSADGFNGDRPDFSNGGKDRYNTRIPASVRHNNPGATWDAKWMTKYGMNGVDIIGGGNHIANFPDAISGAAANFDLMDRKYSGKPLTDFIRVWSGGNSSAQYAARVARELGISPNTVITKDMIRDPDFAPKMLHAMSKQESGRKQGVLTLDQMKAAHGEFREKGLGEKPQPKLDKRLGLMPHTKREVERARHNESLRRKSKQAISDSGFDKSQNIDLSGMPTNFDPNDPIGSLKNTRRKESTNDPSFGMFNVNGRNPFNYAISERGQKELGAIGDQSHLTQIDLGDGVRVTASKGDAKDMEAMLRELKARGYKLNKDTGGYSLRKNVNNPSKWSTHATGATVDINPGNNPNHSQFTDLPPNVKLLAMKYGFAQLHNDKMHFERVPPEFRGEYIKRLLTQGVINREDPIIKQRIAEGVISEKDIEAISPSPKAKTQAYGPPRPENLPMPIKARSMTAFSGIADAKKAANDMPGSHERHKQLYRRVNIVRDLHKDALARKSADPNKPSMIKQTIKPMAAAPGGGIITRGGGISHTGIAGFNANKPVVKEHLKELPKPNQSFADPTKPNQSMRSTSDPKTQSPGEAAPNPKSGGSSGAPSKATSDTYSMPGSSTYNNSADSIPPSPGDSGTGDYSNCLI